MRLSKILVAHDFSEPATRALAYADRIACRVGATLAIVHVHPDVYDGHSNAALGTPWPTPEQEQRYLRFLETELARVAELVLEVRAHHVERRVVRGEPVKRLVALAGELGADMICVGSTGKGAVERVLLGSVSATLLRLSPVPVLTVH